MPAPNPSADWWYYRGDPAKKNALPPAPPWRTHASADAVAYTIPPAEADDTFRPDRADIEMVNAALHLRRPLLVTGRPGIGKSSLARSIAHDLGLGRVLVWPINSRTTLQAGLYSYDSLARLQDSSTGSNGKARALPISRYLRLGPLGTALLPTERPRVLLVDEIDKSDIDLPNDLLHVFERGEFSIPELGRAAKQDEKLGVMPWDGDEEIPLRGAAVQCREFPIVVLTSNGERDFPPAFLRRCLRLEMSPPDAARLRDIVAAHLAKSSARVADWDDKVQAVIDRYLKLRGETREMVATDQLLNALHFVHGGVDILDESNKPVLDAVLRGLVPGTP